MSIRVSSLKGGLIEPDEDAEGCRKVCRTVMAAGQQQRAHR